MSRMAGFGSGRRRRQRVHVLHRHKRVQNFKVLQCPKRYQRFHNFLPQNRCIYSWICMRLWPTWAPFAGTLLRIRISCLPVIRRSPTASWTKLAATSPIICHWGRMNDYLTVFANVLPTIYLSVTKSCHFIQLSTLNDSGWRIFWSSQCRNFAIFLPINFTWNQVYGWFQRVKNCNFKIFEP